MRRKRKSLRAEERGTRGRSRGPVARGCSKTTDAVNRRPTPKSPRPQRAATRTPHNGPHLMRHDLKSCPFTNPLMQPVVATAFQSLRTKNSTERTIMRLPGVGVPNCPPASDCVWLNNAEVAEDSLLVVAELPRQERICGVERSSFLGG
jgi:hypothetical protein